MITEKDVYGYVFLRFFKEYVNRMSAAEKLLELGRTWVPKYDRVDVPDIGEVFIKRLSAGERDRFEAASSKQGGQARRSLVLIHFCFDDRGAALFTEADQTTLDMLDPNLVDPLVTWALSFNSYTKDEQDELRKNLNGQPASS